MTDAERLAKLLPPAAMALLLRRLEDALGTLEGGVVRLTVRCKMRLIQRPIDVTLEERA